MKKTVFIIALSIGYLSDSMAAAAIKTIAKVESSTAMLQILRPQVKQEKRRILEKSHLLKPIEHLARNDSKTYDIKQDKYETIGSWNPFDTYLKEIDKEGYIRHLYCN